MRTARCGFSLIEMMIVLAIVSILFAMGFATLGDQRRSADVQAEAERLAATLRLVRNKAINEQVPYAVAFNIRNGKGTSGAVINNWDGGHYYRILGPNRDLREQLNYTVDNFPSYIDQVRQSWVSDPYYLPERKVRFLALSDLDRGPRSHLNNVYYSGDSTYPRPWFGVYDQNSKTWWPWGGYDPSKDYSGFYYEGADGDIVGSKHPSDRIYDVDRDRSGTLDNKDLNSDGDYDDPFEREEDYVIWTKDEGRNLVNADWLDAAIFFMPTGEAHFLEWNLGRRMHLDQQPALGAAWDDHVHRHGVGDRCMKKSNGVWGVIKNGQVSHLFNTTLTSRMRGSEHPESQHFLPQNGGWFLTLAPDAIQDSNRFETVEDAMASFYPAYRVFVSATGSVRVLRVQARRSSAFLDDPSYGKPWPSSPDKWQDDAYLRKYHQLGWLHKANTVGFLKVPEEIGRPINDKVTGRMLTDRIWWFTDGDLP